METNHSPLSPTCTACRQQPTHRTRQRAMGARPVGEWRTCCAKHLPGSKLTAAPEWMRVQAARLNAHETEALHAS